MDINDVTYQSFGIDPVAYYSTKFADVGARWNFGAAPGWSKRAIGWQKFDFLLDEIRRMPGHDQDGFTVLDLGCGSGRFGSVIKEQFPRAVIVGVDMSENCAETCRVNGYDTAITHDFISGLPFDSNTFHFVFSCDVFGHIEFKDKDAVIAEISRVTKPLGGGWHGIEAAEVDYLSADGSNPDDPVRKYVHIDGHIGVESLDACYQRFSRYMEVTRAFNWLVRPLLETNNALNYDQWGADFSSDVTPLRTPEAAALCDAVLGMLNKNQLDALVSAFGPILTQQRLSELMPDGAFKNYVLHAASWGGFAMLSTRRPRG